MTLDEAIRHAEEVADYDCYDDEQRRCADEHRQLAEWLKELKRLKEAATDTDTISRRAAIYIASGYCHPANIADELRRLPSAQPEIIRCKDCKHFEYDHPYIIQGVPVLGHEVCNAWGDGCKTDENGYCFMAERRTDE